MDTGGGPGNLEEKALTEIDRINQTLGDKPYKLAVVHVDELVFLDKNARHMTNEMFRNLVNNIKRDGGLTSVPFCFKREDGKYLILSGNHRVKAAREAGETHILIMFTDRPLTRQEQIAIQLSHNAIAGQDDMTILKELWEELQDVEMKYYAGLDDKTLDELQKVNLDSLAEVKLDFRTISFIMLPEEIGRLNEIFKYALETTAARDIYLAKQSDYDRALDSLAKVQAAYNIKNVATGLMIILDVFEANQTNLAEGWEGAESKKQRSWAPLSSILGTDKVPVEAAKIIKKAVDTMQARGEVTKKNLWQAIEYWAADYLGGA